MISNFVIQGLGLGNSGAFLFINTMKFESDSEKVEEFLDRIPKKLRNSWN